MSPVILVVKHTFTIHDSRTRMDAYLQRAGAEKVHRTPMTKERWQLFDTAVTAWAGEAEDEMAVMAQGLTLGSSV